MSVEIISYLIIGAISGSLSGLLGIGGGIVVVPGLLMMFEKYDIGNANAMPMIIATSLAVMLVTTFSAAISHSRNGRLMWSVYRKMLPGLVLGALIGVSLTHQLNSNMLRLMLGLVLIFVATQMLFLSRTTVKRDLPSRLGLNFFSTLMSANSALLGIGGGYLSVPFFSRFNMPMQRAIGTATLCGFSVALFGTLGFMFDSWLHGSVNSNGMGPIYWPAFFSIAASSFLFAPIGAKLLHHIPATWLKRVFALLLLGVGVNFLL
jgi:uncharacterized membrane protein YfcA